MAWAVTVSVLLFVERGHVSCVCLVCVVCVLCGVCVLRLVYGLLCGVDVNRNVVSFKTHARFLRRYKATAGTDHHTDAREASRRDICVLCDLARAPVRRPRARARKPDALGRRARGGGARALCALCALSQSKRDKQLNEIKQKQPLENGAAHSALISTVKP